MGSTQRTFGSTILDTNTEGTYYLSSKPVTGC